jgi:hypothetical protein
MKSLKKFNSMKTPTLNAHVVVGGAIKTGTSCSGYDRVKKDGCVITNTHDFNPFNNDRVGCN